MAATDRLLSSLQLPTETYEEWLARTGGYHFTTLAELLAATESQD